MNPLMLGILISFIVVCYFSHYSLISIYIKVLGSYTLCTFIYSYFNKNSVNQKVLISSWEHPNNSGLVLPFIWECDKAKIYIERIKKTSGLKISLTDYFIFACYYALKNEPEFNGRIDFGNYKVSHQEEVSLIKYDKRNKGFQISKFSHPYIYLLDEIASKRRVLKKSPRKTIGNIFMEFILAILPPFILQPLIYLVGYFNKNLETNINCDGIGKGSLGNALLINFGKEGFESIALPMSILCPVSTTLAMGKMQTIPRINNGKIVAKNCIELNLYVDHRYTDGSKGSRMYNKVKSFLNDPSLLKNIIEGHAI